MPLKVGVMSPNLSTHQFRLHALSYVSQILYSIGLKGDCTISMKDDDIMDLFAGKLAPQKVIMHLVFIRIQFVAVNAVCCAHSVCGVHR